jgi:N-acetylneuraminate synthase
MKIINIKEKIIDEKSRPFIVAEAGVNHENDMELAKRLIDEAILGKADAIKFQTYKAEKIAAKESPTYWDASETQREYFQRYDKFGEDEYRELAKYAEMKEIIFMSTPFDFEAVDLLDELVPVFKISSSDITNIPFIKYIAKKGKPIFLSTGASTIGEIVDAVSSIESEGNNKIVLLHCILSYPTKYEHANLNMIKNMKDIFFNYLIGYSDHTKPDKNMMTLTTAFMLGAKVLEKHFTYDKSLKGNDHYHAMDYRDLIVLNNNINIVEKIMGEKIKHPIESELRSREYARRSIVADIDISKGTIIKSNMLTYKRPGTGISPKNLYLVLNRKVKKNIKKDDIIKWSDL